MSNQCGNCKAKGNIQWCESVECYQHENWYPVHLKERIGRLEEAGNNLSGLLEAICGNTDDIVNVALIAWKKETAEEKI